jgi:predicted anti-sigma-YlaC factor YlaD
MNCITYRHYLDSAYLDELPFSLREQLAAHLKRCRSCQELARDMLEQVSDEERRRGKEMAAKHFAEWAERN